MASPQILAPRLLAAFRLYASVTLSRPFLARVVWANSITAESRAIDLLVGQVRKTLPKGERITTERGIGYRFRIGGKEQRHEGQENSASVRPSEGGG